MSNVSLVYAGLWNHLGPLEELLPETDVRFTPDLWTHFCQGISTTMCLFWKIY